MERLSIALAVSILFHVSARSADTLSIVFTGDILLDRGVRRVINHHGVDHLFSEGIDSVFRSAQVVVGNLECPATKIEAPVFKRFIFRAEPEWLDTLRQHGITHLNLANNHSIDQGREGLLDTRRNIIAAGMVPIGAGENMLQASEPVLLASEPRRVWLVPSLRLALENYAYLVDKPCVSQEPMDSLLERVHRIRKADSTAVIHHRLAPLGRRTHTEARDPPALRSPHADTGRSRRADLPPHPHAADHRDIQGEAYLLQHRELHLRPHEAHEPRSLYRAPASDGRRR